MLDVMALGSMPNEEHLRTIEPRRGTNSRRCGRSTSRRRASPRSPGVARALAKRRMPASAANFDDDLAKARRRLEDDLFTPSGEGSRYTTNVEGFFGAQQEWLRVTCRSAARCCR